MRPSFFIFFSSLLVNSLATSVFCLYDNTFNAMENLDELEGWNCPKMSYLCLRCWLLDAAASINVGFLGAFLGFFDNQSFEPCAGHGGRDYH